MGLGRLKEKANPRQSPYNPFSALPGNNDGLTQKTKQATRASTPEGPVDSPGNPFGPLANGQLPGAYPLTERKAAPRKSPTIQMKPKKKKSTDMRLLKEPSTSTLFSALKPTLLFMEAHRIYRERVPKSNPKMSAKKDASIKSKRLDGSEASSAKSKRKASPAPNVLRSPKQPPAKRRISDTRPTTLEMELLQEVTTNDCRSQIISSKSKKMEFSCGASQGIKVLENKFASSESGVKGNTTSKILFNQKSASNRSSDSRSMANTGNFKITDNKSSEQKYPSEVAIIDSILDVAKETGQHDLLALCQGFFADDPPYVLYMEQLEVRSHILPWLIGSLRQEYRIRVIQSKLGRRLRDEELECIRAACIRAAHKLVSSGEHGNWKQFTDTRDATETVAATKMNGPASSTTQKTTSHKALRSLSRKIGGGNVTGACHAIDKDRSLREQALSGTALHRKGSSGPQICSDGGSKKRIAETSVSPGELKQAARRSEKSVTRHQRRVPQEKNIFDEASGSEAGMDIAGIAETRVIQVQNQHQIDENSDSDIKSTNEEGPGTDAIENPSMDLIDGFDEASGSEAGYPNGNPSAQYEHTLPDETAFDEEQESEVDLENVHKSDKTAMQKPIDDSQSGSDVEWESADEEPFSEVEDSEPQKDPKKNENEFDIYEDEEEYTSSNPFSQPPTNFSLQASATALRQVDSKLSLLKSKPAMRSSPLPIDKANARVAAEIARGPHFDPSMENPFNDRPKTETYSEAINEGYSESDWDEDEC